ncbi:M23 family metallopeptidase [Georgenia sp. EYE_87]|nr:M23 family metallopeptidase [Georgenia sp. EYE_87]
MWPTGGPTDVLRPFDEPSAPWAPGHRGVDLESEVGSAVGAAADGVVVFAGTVVDRPVVSIEHPDGIRTTYEPVRPLVRAGQQVAAGETIGHLDGLHCLVLPPGACLHLGARTGPETYVDPLRLLGADVVIRLLPDPGEADG